MNFYFFLFYLFPIVIAIISMIWGIVLLRKHEFVMLLPWIMGIAFVVFFFILCLGVAAFLVFDIWIVSFLTRDLFLSLSIMWGGACMIANFCCAVVAYIILGSIMKKETIGYEKKYFRIYLLVTLMPIIIFLSSWIHYNLIDVPTIQAVLFIVFELINIGILLGVNKWRGNVEKNFNSVRIKIGISVFLLIFIIIFKVDIGFRWYLSYWLLYYLYDTVCEVKKSRQDTYPLLPKLNADRKRGWFIEYIPIVGMTVSCLLFIMLIHNN